MSEEFLSECFLSASGLRRAVCPLSQLRGQSKADLDTTSQRAEGKDRDPWYSIAEPQWEILTQCYPNLHPLQTHEAPSGPKKCMGEQKTRPNRKQNILESKVVNLSHD